MAKIVDVLATSRDREEAENICRACARLLTVKGETSRFGVSVEPDRKGWFDVVLRER